MLRRTALGLMAGGPLVALQAQQAQAADIHASVPLATTTNGNVAYVSPSGGDDTASINNALQSFPVVILLPGTFTITAPLQFTMAGQLLSGFMGATQAGAGFPGVNTVIRVGSTFTAPAISSLAANATNPAGMVMNGLGSNPQGRCEIRDLWLDAAGAFAQVSSGMLIQLLPLDCITVWARNDGFAVRRVGCGNATGYGLNVNNVSGVNTDVEGLLAEDLLLQHCALGGVLANSTDISMTNVHAQSNTASGADGITVKAGNARLVQCRSDLNGGNGFSVGTFNGTQGLGAGVTMIGCGTEGNQLAAVRVAGGGTTTYGPVQMTGCWFQDDGNDNGNFSANPQAAVVALGRVVVDLTDVLISCGDAGKYPAYSVQTLKNDSGAVPDLVTVMGGVWQAATAFVSDVLDTSSTSARTRHQIIGTLGFIGATSGTTGTTTFVPVTWP